MMNAIEYSYKAASGKRVVLGRNDVTPGLLAKLRAHATDDRYEVIEVRDAASGKILSVIPAHVGDVGDCCPRCCQHTPRHKGLAE